MHGHTAKMDTTRLYAMHYNKRAMAFQWMNWRNVFVSYLPLTLRIMSCVIWIFDGHRDVSNLYQSTQRQFCEKVSCDTIGTSSIIVANKFDVKMKWKMWTPSFALNIFNILYWYKWCVLFTISRKTHSRKYVFICLIFAIVFSTLLPISYKHPPPPLPLTHFSALPLQ